MRALYRVSFLLLMCAMLIGCGDTSSTEKPAPPTASDAIRRDLDYIVQNKIVGSEVINIQENIERLKETEPDKAAALLVEFKKLDAAHGAKAAAIAKKMLEIL